MPTKKPAPETESASFVSTYTLLIILSIPRIKRLRRTLQP
ncbi:hypothetical protein Hsw_3416 [Hymenobacter swuensis DY53]|uniref:Uncharacterized protein n=1 Tax=Hymenobacter swuensis DY53 TaxID=1227739 RepID=W8F8S0_9BACT|nr:hypothetical protein Hsw_3416 [Hymenobacter swuensis DY53]